jgi:hypothetical protein
MGLPLACESRNHKQHETPWKESAHMEEQAAMVGAATEYVGRWNRLISKTNWEKGLIIFEWRAALQQADVPASSYTDDAWSQQVGGVTPQHVGRLRRVHERFAEVQQQYAGLFWSHFQAALDWPDAEMYLEGAVQNGWSVAQMRTQRWEAMGGEPELEPQAADDVATELDEDVSAGNDSPLPATISESMGEVHGADDFSEYDASDPVPFDSNVPSMSDEMNAAPGVSVAPLLRPFESLPPLPEDLKEAFELMKLAILAHKVCAWAEIARDDVLSVLESLKQLALAPAE